VIEATPIGGRRSDFFTAGKLAPGSLGLFQQHRLEGDIAASQQAQFRIKTNAALAYLRKSTSFLIALVIIMAAVVVVRLGFLPMLFP